MKSKDEKGAVSVLVTLLLIPAILVSGTAVDTARIYTAVGILQSANELAANAVQTQYDALLHDLYGLFGISTDEADLEDMAAKYIEASIFGEGEGGGGGALKLFYGSSSGRPELMFDADKNLGNLEVLQRQIEQYIKFRAPALVMGEFFWGFLPGTFGEDIAIVGEKLLIDALLQECLDKFRELYAAITEADRCRSVVGVGSFGSMSASLVSIQEQFSALGECYENYLATDEGTDEKTLYFERLNGIIAKIKQLSAGGSPRLAVWTDGRRDSSGNWVVGHWSTQSSSVVGLAGNIANAKTKAENFKAQFLAVEELAQELDSKKLELSDLIDSLEHRLQAGICGEKLKAGMLEKHGSPPKSLIEAYREALAWELLPLAQKYRGAGDEYIEKVKTMLDNVKYREADDDSKDSLTPEELADLEFEICSQAAYFAAFLDVSYHLPMGFTKFGGTLESGAMSPGWEANEAFFLELSKLAKGTGGETVALDGSRGYEPTDSEKKQREITGGFLEEAKEAYELLPSEPQGAKYVGAPIVPAASGPNICDPAQLWQDIQSEMLPEVFGEPENIIKAAADHILPLAYGAAMFSNFTTSKPGGAAAMPEKSIAGVPLGREVNYFYQSELEYLYNGSDDAAENLAEVARMVFLARLMSNYVSVFGIGEIAEVARSVQDAFSWFPGLGVVLGEGARSAFAVAETVADMASLLEGNKGSFVKGTGEWLCLPESGLGAALEKAGEVGTEDGVSYYSYLFFFLIARAPTLGAGDGLVERIARLIELNMINYKNRLDADEVGMNEEAARPDRFKLTDLKTDFVINASVNMRMLFLSMPFAQKGINGIVPPKTAQFFASCYRGY